MSSQEEASDPWGIPSDEKPPQPSADTSPSPLAPETPPAEPKPPFSQVLAAAQSVFGARDKKADDDLPPEPPSWLTLEEPAAPEPAPLAVEGPAVETAVQEPATETLVEEQGSVGAAPEEPAPAEPVVVEPASVDWWAAAGAWPVTKPIEPAPPSWSSPETEYAPASEPEQASSPAEWPLADAESVFVLPDWGTEGAPAEPAVAEDLAEFSANLSESSPGVEEAMSIPEPSLTDIEAVIHQIEIGGRPGQGAEEAAGPWPLEVDAEAPLVAEPPPSPEGLADMTAIAPLEVEVTPPQLPPPPPTIGEAAGPVVVPRPDETQHETGWGTGWRSAAQGWVEDEFGRSVWRPIITSTDSLAEWAVDTYLGLVAADVTVEGDDLEAGLPTARRTGERRMVEEALRRGAHAVLGVTTGMSSAGNRTVVTVSGTAVTLKTA